MESENEELSDKNLDYKSPLRAMSQSSLVFIDNDCRSDGFENSQGAGFNKIVMTAEELNQVSSSGTTRMKNASLNSPVSLDMPMSEIQPRSQDTSVRHDQLASKNFSSP